MADIALWAVPAGLVGARLYHVATDHDLYFGEGRRALGALEIWHGGLGIWGAIAGGLVGAWFYCHRHGVLLRPLADALAPGLLLAQVIGRFGNYFNQELFGRPTTLPWGLEIDLAHRPVGYAQFDDVPPDLPLRGAVEPRRHRPAALPRPAVPARLRPRVRALRDDLHRRARLDRDPPDRHDRAQRRARPPVGRVDVDRALRRCGHLLRGDRPAPSAPGQPGADAVRRRSWPGRRRADRGPRRAGRRTGPTDETASTPDADPRPRPPTPAGVPVALAAAACECGSTGGCTPLWSLS